MLLIEIKNENRKVRERKIIIIIINSSKFNFIIYNQDQFDEL
jgi:hypothetical protein